MKKTKMDYKKNKIINNVDKIPVQLNFGIMLNTIKNPIIEKIEEQTNSSQDIVEDNIMFEMDSALNGSQIKLKYKYNLWSHDIYNKNWNIDSYNKICQIDNISDFWKLFNNFNKMNIRVMHFFFMKEGTEPVWEHESNRSGGVCSFKIEINKALSLWEDLNSRMACNCLTNDAFDINGISISPKNNWAILKIWNRNKENDLSIMLSKEVLEKYANLSIKYKNNEPEY